MKKLIMAVVVIAAASLMASVDVYKFKSSMRVYSLAKKGYVTTPFNGELTIDSDTGVVTLKALKRNTQESFEMTCDEPFGIVSGKKDRTGAVLFDFESEASTNGILPALQIVLSGDGRARTKTEGCGPCGETSTCTKITSLTGTMVGLYDCGCPNPQHYGYTGECVPLEERDETHCPIRGTWRASLKTVDGKRYR